jgi:hypothetical protein
MVIFLIDMETETSGNLPLSQLVNCQLTQNDNTEKYWGTEKTPEHAEWLRRCQAEITDRPLWR